MSTTEGKSPDLDRLEFQRKLADAGQQNACAREKYWSELSIEEKIERTRQMVKRCQNEQQAQAEWLSAQQEEIRFLQERFNAHVHGQNGLGYLPANFSTDGRLARGYTPKRYLDAPQICLGDRNVVDPDKVYF